MRSKISGAQALSEFRSRRGSSERRLTQLRNVMQELKQHGVESGWSVEERRMTSFSDGLKLTTPKGPRMISLGVATDIDVGRLAERTKHAAAMGGQCFYYPRMVGAWARTPDRP